jgi:hypothetical protein
LQVKAEKSIGIFLKAKIKCQPEAGSTGRALKIFHVVCLIANIQGKNIQAPKDKVKRFNNIVSRHLLCCFSLNISVR